MKSTSAYIHTIAFAEVVIWYFLIGIAARQVLLELAILKLMRVLFEVASLKPIVCFSIKLWRVLFMFFLQDGIPYGGNVERAVTLNECIDFLNC